MSASPPFFSVELWKKIILWLIIHYVIGVIDPASWAFLEYRFNCTDMKAWYGSNSIWLSASFLVVFHDKIHLNATNREKMIGKVINLLVYLKPKNCGFSELYRGELLACVTD